MTTPPEQIAPPESSAPRQPAALPRNAVSGKIAGLAVLALIAIVAGTLVFSSRSPHYAQIRAYKGIQQVALTADDIAQFRHAARLVNLRNAKIDRLPAYSADAKIEGSGITDRYQIDLENRCLYEGALGDSTNGATRWVYKLDDGAYDLFKTIGDRIDEAGAPAVAH